MNIWDATREAFALLFSGDAELWRIIFISLRVSLTALLIATPFAILLGYALAHRDLIVRFGRFPARNEALGRVSTPDERDYLDELTQTPV